MSPTDNYWIYKGKVIGKPEKTDDKFDTYTEVLSDDYTIDENGKVWAASFGKTTTVAKGKQPPLKGRVINGQSSSAKITESKPSATEPLEEEPMTNQKAADKTGAVIGLGATVAEEGTMQLAKLGATASNSAETIEEGIRIGKGADQAIKASATFRVIGVTASWYDAGSAIAEATKKPTLGNITKAFLKTGLAALETWGKVNPAVGIITSILDLSGITDRLFNW